MGIAKVTSKPINKPIAPYRNYIIHSKDDGTNNAHDHQELGRKADAFDKRQHKQCRKTEWRSCNARHHSPDNPYQCQQDNDDNKDINHNYYEFDIDREIKKICFSQKTQLNLHHKNEP